MKHRARLSEVQIAPATSAAPPASPPLPPPADAAPARGFTVRLPQGVTLSVPSGFDPDELTVLLAVVRESLT